MEEPSRVLEREVDVVTGPSTERKNVIVATMRNDCDVKSTVARKEKMIWAVSILEARLLVDLAYCERAEEREQTDVEACFISKREKQKFDLTAT